MAQITVTIRTYFEDGEYRNNTVNMEIPDKAAVIIKDAWSSLDGPMAQHKAITSKWLSKNQCANAELRDSDGTIVAGILGMVDRYKVENETITRRFDDED